MTRVYVYCKVFLTALPFVINRIFVTSDWRLFDKEPYMYSLLASCTLSIVISAADDLIAGILSTERKCEK